MTPNEAAEVIRALAKYLRENPNQFYVVNAIMTGATITGEGPGSIGLQATATGGSGSGDVIGANFNPQFGPVAISFTQAQGDEAARGECPACV